MGKALLVLVLGAGIVLTKQLYNTTQTEARTSKDQRAYQEEVIAREIAMSAFNVGMGEVRAYGDEVLAGARALNGDENEGRRGTYASGRFAGGEYTVRADPTSGHSVRIVATGTFGEAEYTMHDEYRVYVMTAEEGGFIDVSFLESMAGYCSAVFLEMYEMDMPEGVQPEPIMLFAPDNRDRRTARPAQLIWADPGTQLNFYIAVDKNCSSRPSSSMSECELREYARQYTYNPSDFDHTHNALTVESGNLDQAQEDIWAFVEQRPGFRNIWRVGWEDQHITSWDKPESQSPNESLQALKMFGYDGLGWPEADDKGYRLLRDYGNRPDFSDQVIEVGVVSPSSPNYQEQLDEYYQAQTDCGEELDDLPEDTVLNQTPDEDGTDDGGTDDGGTDDSSTEDGGTTEDDGPTTLPDEDEDEAEESPGDSMNEFACSCRQSWKTPLLHRPPGNQANEQLLCLPDPAVRTHLRRHNDVVLSCRSSRRRGRR